MRLPHPTELLPRYNCPTLAQHLAYMTDRLLGEQRLITIVDPKCAYSEISVKIELGAGAPFILRNVDFNGSPQGAVQLTYGNANTVVTELKAAYNWIGQNILSQFGARVMTAHHHGFKENLRDAKYKPLHELGTEPGKVDWTLLNALFNHLYQRKHLSDNEAAAVQGSPFWALPPSTSDHYAHRLTLRLVYPAEQHVFYATMVARTTLQICDSTNGAHGTTRALHFDTLNPQNTVEHVLEICSTTWPHTQPEAVDA